MKLLYWNLKQNNLINAISECLIEHDVDIAIFSEYDQTDIKRMESNYSLIDTLGGTKRVILVCKKGLVIELVREHARYAIYEMSLADKRIFIAGVHLHDMFYRDKEDRKEAIRNLLSDLDIARGSNESRVIIGDFNATPFSDELLLFNCFNSTLFKDVIEAQPTRTRDGIVYERLYNPILDYISASKKMYGSYYHAGEPASTVWYCIDQLLVSANLIDAVTNMTYLRVIKGRSLIKSLKPNDKDYSDHLPLLAEINL